MYQKNPYSTPPPRTTVTQSALRRKLFLIKAIFVIVAVIAVFWFLTSCRIETITVQGASQISETEVLEDINIKTGKHLFSVTEKKISQAVKAISPYVRDVTVTKRLPSTLIIHVSEREARYHTEYEGEYYLLSEDLIVLEKAYDAILAVSIAPCKLLLSDIIEETSIGEKLAFKEKSEQIRTEELLKTFEQSPLTEKMTELDLREPYGLCAIVSGQYTLKFGSAENLSKKLTLCQKSVSYLSSHMGRVTGILYATDAEKVSFVMTGVAN